MGSLSYRGAVHVELLFTIVPHPCKDMNTLRHVMRNSEVEVLGSRGCVASPTWAISFIGSSDPKCFPTINREPHLAGAPVVGATRDDGAVLAGHAPVRNGTCRPRCSWSALRCAQEVLISATRILPAGIVATAIVGECQVRILRGRSVLVVGGIERGWEVELHVCQEPRAIVSVQC